MNTLLPFIAGTYGNFAPVLLAPLFLSSEGLLNPALAKTINLAIFIFISYLLIRKPLRQMFAERLAGVRELLQRAANEKEAASKKMAELESRIDRLGDELESIRERTAAEAAAEQARIEAETERDIERLRQTAHREIEIAGQVAISELRSFVATRSVDLAEELIRQELTPVDDSRLIRRVGEELTKVK